MGILTITVACLSAGMAPALAESRQQDGGGGKDPTNMDPVVVHGLRGASASRGGGVNLNRLGFNPNGMHNGRSSARPANDERHQDCEQSPETGQPVVIASGNKVLDETDFATADGVFVFTRSCSRQRDASYP